MRKFYRSIQSSLYPVHTFLYDMLFTPSCSPVYKGKDKALLVLVSGKYVIAHCNTIFLFLLYDYILFYQS